MQERRHYGRVPVRLDVIWKNESAESFAQIADLSPAGCFVSTTFELPEGEEVRLEVFMPRGGTIRLWGVVAHERWPAGFGVRFTGFGSDEDYAELLALVR